jgi:hypothetical protein
LQIRIKEYTLANQLSYMNNLFNRRKFITSTAVSTIAAIALPQIVEAGISNSAAKKVSLNANDCFKVTASPTGVVKKQKLNLTLLLC